MAGLDLGGTKLAAALFDVREDGSAGFVRALENRSYEDIKQSAAAGVGEAGDGKAGAKGASECVADMIVDAMAAAVDELRDGRTAREGAVGVCSAGFVEDGVIIEAWNTGMKNYPLRDRVAARTGMKTLLYKDSWAPVFGLSPEEPSIIFSIGTGLGGVSCDPGPAINIRSRTAARWPAWIPHLRCNDDPGYAVFFTQPLMQSIIERAVDRNSSNHNTDEPGPAGECAALSLASRVYALGRERGRLTPSRPELFAARLFAPRAVAGMKPGAVFADLACAAEMPSLLYRWITGNEISPAELDGLPAAGDPGATLAATIHAGFIGYALFRMQQERKLFRLPPAVRVFGTGSGFNSVNAPFLGREIVSAMNAFCAEAGINGIEAESVECIDTGDMPTTFACLGAATGAAMGID